MLPKDMSIRLVDNFIKKSSSNPSERFVLIQQEIFDKDLLKNKKLLKDLYVVTETGDLNSRYDVASKMGIKDEKVKSLISKYFPEIKDDTLETQELILLERFIKNNKKVVLVGVLGSGKTHKIEYVWEKYLKNSVYCQNKCKNKDKCILKNPLRIRCDVDHEKYVTVEDFYRETALQIITSIELRIGENFSQEIHNYYSQLTSSYDAAEKIYLKTLNSKKILQCFPFDITSEVELQDFIISCNELEKYHMLLFLLDFSIWLCNKYNLHPFCLSLIFDNIDKRPKKIKDSIFEIMENHNSTNSIFIICAARHETYINYDLFDTTKLDIIEHTAPQPEKVVLSRLDYLTENFESGSHLKELFPTSHSPHIFIENLRELIEYLTNNKRITSFINDIFGFQVRNSLDFAKSIVDIAASNTKEDLEFITGKSYYNFIRLMIFPWGDLSVKSYITNVYDLSNKTSHRLTPLRILLFIMRNNDFTFNIDDIKRHLSLFHNTSSEFDEEVINILNKMVKKRLITAQTDDNFDIVNSAKMKIKLTALGRNIINQNLFSFHPYISTQMFFSNINPKYYNNIHREETFFLTQSVEIFRQYVWETSLIELKELKHVYDTENVKAYTEIYGHTFTYSIYRDGFRALIPISKSSNLDEIYLINTLNDFIVFLLNLRLTLKFETKVALDDICLIFINRNTKKILDSLLDIYQYKIDAKHEIDLKPRMDISVIIDKIQIDEEHLYPSYNLLNNSMEEFKE